jgi:predicted nucleotidyltransferase
VSVERHGGIRAVIALEAARLMLEEGVKQYFVAKRIAAKRKLGKTGGKRTRYRPTDLPSNGEIREGILELAKMSEGSRRLRRLFAMRITAIESMRALDGFEPRLIGSVSTGHVRKGSDVDLSIFTADEGALEHRLRELKWTFTRELATIQKAGHVREYVHYHVADVFSVELTIYQPRELRERPRSSTDGKPIVRLRLADVEILTMREHPEEWEDYLADGTVAGLAEIVEEEEEEDDDASPMPSLGFDGWLEDAPEHAGASPLFDE